MRKTLLLALAPATLFAQAADSSRTRRDTSLTLESITVSAIRARDLAPVSAKTLDAAELTRRSFGQDVPLVLQGTPSLTSYAETGNYWGYSYIRLRGIDQSRINFTIDGIPLNDPEDQVLYFADFPDLTNSIGSVQVQRGVGTSAPGTASYGGSINFQTIPIANTNRGGELQLQGGSFGSARASAEYATGLTNRRVAIYGRLSAIQSAGYRRHSGMEGRSAFLSAAYVGDRDILKLTAMAGVFSDTLAYYGATKTELAADRKSNILRPDEVDRFGERIAALSYSRALGANASVSGTAYRISASGAYDVCINGPFGPTVDPRVGCVFWNFNLDFIWYGVTSVVTIDHGRASLSAGANANTYSRDHYAYARPNLLTPLYLNTGHKRDASAFAKLSYDLGRVTLFGDVQARHAEFRYAPDVNAGVPEASIPWTFFNPKVGATLRLVPTISAYASYGVNGREPARSDMLAGFDNLDTSNTTFVGPLARVRPEHARDLEAGLRRRGARWSLDANVFAMDFRDEILPVGQLSYIGTPLRTNVRSSWRRGIEADVSARPVERLRLGLTATAMRARIASFIDDATGLSYRNVPPLLTPEFTSAQTASFDLSRVFSVAAVGRFTGNSRLTNTNDPAFALPSHYVVDLSATWTRGTRGVSVFVNNATNTRGYASGHVALGEARYYVLPPLNVMLLVRLGT